MPNFDLRATFLNNLKIIVTKNYLFQRALRILTRLILALFFEINNNFTLELLAS